MEQPKHRKLYVAVGVGMFVVVTFWHELRHRVTDSVLQWLSNDPAPVVWMDYDLPQVRNIRFDRDRNNIRNVTVGTPAVSGTQDGQRRITFHLSTSAAGDDYPALKLVFFDRANHLVRIGVLSAGQYSHGDTFASEQVIVDVPIKPGEQRVSVHAFYEQEATP